MVEQGQITEKTLPFKKEEDRRPQTVTGPQQFLHPVGETLPGTATLE